MALGYPFNIASYALLVYILAKVTNLIPSNLYIGLGDAHIYKSHIDKVQIQLTRKPYPFPQLQIVKDYECNQDPIEWIESLNSKDFKLINYTSHPKLTLQMVA